MCEIGVGEVRPDGFSQNRATETRSLQDVGTAANRGVGIEFGRLKWCGDRKAECCEILDQPSATDHLGPFGKEARCTGIRERLFDRHERRGVRHEERRIVVAVRQVVARKMRIEPLMCGPRIFP